MMGANEAVRFDREESDAIFMETLNDIDNLNNRDGRFAYADYVTLHNDISALYDSFSYVDELINSLQSQLAGSQRMAQDTRNELCYKCGRYAEAHNGACDGCKWKKGAEQ